MTTRRGILTLATMMVLAAFLTLTEGQNGATRYYYNNPDVLLTGRCTCKDTNGNSITFNVCTPSRGGVYNQCTGCGLGNILPKCRATALARGLTDTCTNYSENGCALNCEDGGCLPNACYRGSC